MKRIPLTQGQFTLVDDADFELIKGLKWHAALDKATNSFNVYGVIKDANCKRKHIALHRFLLNAPKGMEVDHINHDTLDNRRENLRLCSHKDNCKNKRVRSDSSSGYKGVKFIDKKKYYVATIYVNGSVKYLGSNKDIVEAARMYNVAAKQYFGEFAYLNKI